MDYKAMNQTFAYSPKSSQISNKSYYTFSKQSDQVQKGSKKVQFNHSGLNPPNNLALNLINRIKEARRPNVNSFRVDQNETKDEFNRLNMTFGQQNSQKFKIKRQEQNEPQNNLQKMSIASNRKKLNNRIQQFSNRRCTQLQKLQLDNLSLKSQLRAIQEQNKRFYSQIRRYETVTQQYLQIIESLKRTIEQKQIQHRSDLKKLQSQIHVGQNQMFEEMMKKVYLMRPEQYNSDKLQISSKVIDEIILPIEVVKNKIVGQQQSKSLQLAKIQLQKKYMSHCNRLGRQKDEEIQTLRKGFSKKLNYYKEMLIKLTSKPLVQISKYQQDTLSTVILQTSSDNDQM